MRRRKSTMRGGVTQFGGSRGRRLCTQSRSVDFGRRTSGGGMQEAVFFFIARCWEESTTRVPVCTYHRKTPHGDVLSQRFGHRPRILCFIKVTAILHHYDRSVGGVEGRCLCFVCVCG